MKSKTVSRGILYYIFLLIAVVVGVLCIIGAILLLSPGTEIFGISYYNRFDTTNITTVADENQQSYEIDQLFDSGRVDVVNVTTNHADVTIQNRESVRIQFFIEGAVTGIVTSENKNSFNYSISYSAQTRTLNLDVTAPILLLTFNNSMEVVLSLPYEFVDTNIDFVVNTQSGDVSVGNHERDTYTLNSLTVNAENSSNVLLGNHANVKNEINLNVPSGEIRFNTDVVTGELNITSESARIRTSDIEAQNVKLVTQGSSVNMNNIQGNFDYSARRGVIIVGDITGNLTCSEEVVIANITVGTVDGNVILPNAESSNITIEALNGRGDITTTSGNVTIRSANAILEVQTQSGKIDVTVDTNPTLITGGYEEELGVINLETQSGEIAINFANVYLQNYITTTSGTINCAFSASNNLVLSYDCTNNAPTLSTGITTGEVQNQGEYTIGNSSTRNKITIKNTDGRTSISDTY